MTRWEFIQASVGCMVAFRTERALALGSAHFFKDIDKAMAAAGAAYDAMEALKPVERPTNIDDLPTQGAAIEIPAEEVPHLAHATVAAVSEPPKPLKKRR